MQRLSFFVALLICLPALHLAAFETTLATGCLLVTTVLVIQLPILRDAPTWTLMFLSLLTITAATIFNVDSDSAVAWRSLAEAASFSLIVVVAQKTSRAIHRFSRALDELDTAISGQGAIPFEHWSEHIDAALANGRRFDQPFSVIDVSFKIPESSTALDTLLRDLSKRFKRRLVLQNIGGILNESLRKTDVVLGDFDAGSLVVVCRSTDNEQADHVARSIARSAQDAAGLEARCSMASFPADGVTFTDLLDHARNEDRNRPVQFTARP